MSMALSPLSVVPGITAVSLDALSVQLTAKSLFIIGGTLLLPDGRTVRVGGEDRLVLVGGEDRLMLIDVEDRLILVRES